MIKLFTEYVKKIVDKISFNPTSKEKDFNSEDFFNIFLTVTPEEKKQYKNQELQKQKLSYKGFNVTFELWNSFPEESEVFRRNCAILCEMMYCYTGYLNQKDPKETNPELYFHGTYEKEALDYIEQEILRNRKLAFSQVQELLKTNFFASETYNKVGRTCQLVYQNLVGRQKGFLAKDYNIFSSIEARQELNILGGQKATTVKPRTL